MTAGYDQITFQRLAAFASAGGQVQMTPFVALHIGGGITQHKYLDDEHDSDDDTFRSYSYGARLLLSVSEDVDVGPYVTVAYWGPVETVAGGVGMAVR